MKQIIFILIAILSFHSSMAQYKSGEIIYGVNSKGFHLDSLKKAHLTPQQKMGLALMEETKKTAAFLTFNLTFNKQAALFTHKSFMNNDNGLNPQDALSSVHGKGLYYTSIKANQSLHQKNDALLDKKLLIATNLDSLDWHITDQTKLINGYRCYKATTTIEIVMDQKNITAWFAPELPFSYGPIGYGGLPGMILGLYAKPYYFYPKSIALSEQHKTLKKPTEGEHITYYKYIKELRKEGRFYIQHYKKSKNDKK